jgi:hypothetical protein
MYILHCHLYLWDFNTASPLSFLWPFATNLRFLGDEIDECRTSESISKPSLNGFSGFQGTECESKDNGEV